MESGGPIGNDYQYQNQVAWEEQTRLAKSLNSCEEENKKLRAALERAAAILTVADCPLGNERNRMIVAGNGIRAAIAKYKGETP